MKKWIFLFCSITAVIIVMTFIVKGLKTDAVNYKKISFEEYQQKVKNNETFYLYFYENGCTGCQGFSPSLNELIKEENLTVYGVELSQYKTKYKDYIIDKNIKQVPTLVFYNKGKEATRIGGGDNSKSQIKLFFTETNKLE